MDVMDLIVNEVSLDYDTYMSKYEVREIWSYILLLHGHEKEPVQ